MRLEWNSFKYRLFCIYISICKLLYINVMCILYFYKNVELYLIDGNMFKV